MSDEISRIVDQMERGFRGDAWHGSPLRDIVRDLDAATAARHIVPGTHSIWELVLHIDTWLNVVRRRVLREAYDPTAEQDWPQVVTTTPQAWNDAMAMLDRSHERLLDAVRALAPDDLERPVSGKPYDIYILLHGALQHTLYHAGQIALLKRAATAA